VPEVASLAELNAILAEADAAEDGAGCRVGAGLRFHQE
jgi:hypothetical protein